MSETTSNEFFKKKLVGRDKEIQDIKDILKREKCVVIQGGDGTGKYSLVRHLMKSDEVKEYENIFEYSDLEYSSTCMYNVFLQVPAEDRTKYNSLKEYIMTCKEKILVVVHCLAQHPDAEIYEKLSEQLPIDEESCKNIENDHHFIFIRSQEFKELKHITHYQLGNIESDDNRKQLFREYLEIELTDAQMTQAIEVTKGNPLFSKMLSRYINTIQTEAIDTLLENLQSHQEEAQLELARLILQDFQSGKYSNERLLSTYCWFAPFSIYYHWLQVMAQNQGLHAKDVQIFSSTMCYFGFWEIFKKFNDTTIIVPGRSACKLLRNVIEDQKEYLNDFLIITGRYSITLSEFEDVLLTRHLFYYHHSKEYFNDVQKARILLVCARVIYNSYQEVEKGLKWTEEALDILKGSGEYIEIIAHLRIADIQINEKIAKYEEAITHLKLYIQMNEVYHIKAKMDLNPTLVSNAIIKIALCYERLKMHEKAIEVFQEALEKVSDEKEPEYSSALYYICKNYFFLGNYKESLHYAAQSIRVCELYDRVVIDQYLYSAKSLYMLGNKKRAQYFIDKIKNLNQKYPVEVPQYLQNYNTFVKENQPQSLIPTSTKYIVTSTILISIASFVIFKYLKK
ncbi:hypothetical protein DLAC_05712 [Tieghemostelium lacteum]|uniref:Uncharacterized protein n=1 Tax=Tieghemostelium lacteum TaxID=361077 RepID=A0A151ZGQ4_TIELA|nr:hypothetical protein DLAC_05712 [Tieghemostelium lacteum]|eukprot:KYQ93089.1 hypothetical protein DLAC_05712 [Tieghemostelium lacteum]